MQRDTIVRVDVKFWRVLAVLLLTVAPILSACNTVHGVGEDLSAAGRGIAHTADKVSGNK